MKINLNILIVLSAIFFSSCNYQKKLQEQLYFNDALDSTQRVLSRYSATVKVDDRISIQVSALNPESAIPYNLSVAGSGMTSATAVGYLVERDGTILFPQFGKLSVEGKTLTEVRSMLLDSLAGYLVDPIVTVQYANAKIVVMGEVGHPGVLPIPDGKLTILEAITMSGDIPYTGRKDNVLIVREDNGKRDFARVDIRSHNIYKSPYFYLRQNDLVFVEPTLQKVRQQTNQTILSNVSLITSVVGILTTSMAFFIYLKAVK
jgi:polysaccharide export outer membrane protein